MARSQARIRTAVWRNRDFTSLDASAQGTYWMVLSQSDVTMAGTIAYLPERWRSFRGDPDNLDRDLRELEDGSFLVIDRATREAWVRSFVKNDGVLASPKTRNSMWSAWRGILSLTIRRRFLEQLDEPHIEEAIEEGWTARDEVEEALAHTPPMGDGSPTDTPSEPKSYPQAGYPIGSGFPRARAASASASASSSAPLAGAREAPPPPDDPATDEGGGSSIPGSTPNPDATYGQRSIGRLPGNVLRAIDRDNPTSVARLHRAVAAAHDAGIPASRVYDELQQRDLMAGTSSPAAVAASRIEALIPADPDADLDPIAALLGGTDA